MAKMIAFCGLSCTDCPTLPATQKNDDKERKRIAELWSKQYGGDFKPADINCDGCVSKSGRFFKYCNICEIRKCGLTRHVKNCAYCSDYICEKLGKFFDRAPVAKANLEEIRKRK